MYIKCYQCKTRHSVTNENIRADGSSVKCRDCDTVIYFKNPPPVRIEREEPIEPIIMPPEIEENWEEEEYSKPVSIPPWQDAEKEYKETTAKVPLPKTKIADATSTFQSVFDNIAEKLEKLSEEKSDADYNLSLNTNLGDISGLRILIILIVGIFLISLALYFLPWFDL